MFNKNRFKDGYKKYIPKAKEYMENKEKAEGLLTQAMGKAKKKRSSLKDVWEKVQLLFEVFRAWIKGEYKQIPKGSIITIIATIIYFVAPIDIIPDFIFSLGIIDDAAVIGFALNQISRDLDQYKQWKEANSNN